MSINIAVIVTQSFRFDNDRKGAVHRQSGTWLQVMGAFFVFVIASARSNPGPFALGFPVLWSQKRRI